MKNVSIPSALSFLLLFTLGFSALSQAQLRKDQHTSSDYTGPIVKEDPSEGANLGNLFNMQMSHSYSMNFASFGGQMHNMNAYTNTMQFFFSEDLTGRVDLQVLHSPFGNNFTSNNNPGMDMQFRVRNAELNYQISDKSNISIQFQQVPYGMSPWSAGANRNPFYSPFRGHNFD